MRHEVKSGAAFAKDQVASLLQSLASDRTSGRQKAVRKFESYFFQYNPDLPRDSIQTLLVGTSTKPGIVYHSGAISEAKPGVLKKTATEVLGLLSRLVCGDEQPAIQAAFVNLPLAELERINWQKHVISKTGEIQQSTLLAFSLLLRILSADDCCDLSDLLPSRFAQEKFETWAEEQESSEQEEEEEVPEATCWADVVINVPAAQQPTLMLSPSKSTNERESKRDPLGVVQLDLRALSMRTTRSYTKTKTVHSSVLSAGVHKLNKRAGEINKRLASSSIASQIGISRKETRMATSTSLDDRRTGVSFGLHASGDSAGSINTSDQNFSPTQFLQTVHKKTSYDDLCGGLKHLQKVTGARTSQLTQLVHDHFDEFVSCRDTIDRIQQMVGTMLEEDSSQTHAADTALQEAAATAARLFKPLLEQSEEAKRLRNMLSVLRRFHMYFNLPASMQKHLSDGNFEDVVAEYEKAQVCVSSFTLFLLFPHRNS
jgi:hypothetical protein